MTTPAFAPDEFRSQPAAPAARPDLLLSLRSWQTDAYHAYLRVPRRDFLLVATPGAGKTAFALTIASSTSGPGPRTPSASRWTPGTATPRAGPRLTSPGSR